MGFDDLKILYPTDVYFQPIYTEISAGNHRQHSDFSIHDGFLFRGTCLCVPETSLRNHIIWEVHGGGLAGHFGRDKTIAMMEDRFYWLTLHKDVHRIITHCRTCQLAKRAKSNASLYSPLPLFSKMMHFVPYAKTYDASQVADLFLKEDHVKSWDLILSHAKFAYNNNVNRTTGLSPSEVVLGLKLWQPIDLIPLPIDLIPLPINTRTNEGGEDFARNFQKLHPCRVGPFKVLKRVGPNAYVLELPEDLQVSPIFNEDLQPYEGHYANDEDPPVVPPSLPRQSAPKHTIEDILDDQIVSTC
ncbi:uncharacterized protein LOC120112087 [Phoenix dactylifera]|uniref:Uncharacterized protein LOC120112087 n=1 Tax=Phoenix dactylifera TaxID=42345 RepID=A0A8B9AIN3_PHODC|nr:uncharacterized protein LOC120112087 [Phoenix dactylifera]